MAIKRLDMAAAKGVIHRNAAARRKSRLVAQVRRASSEA
jgi:ribosomal protein S20